MASWKPITFTATVFLLTTWVQAVAMARCPESNWASLYPPQRALKMLQSGAERGDVRYQRDLGLIYENDAKDPDHRLGTRERDLAEEFKWYRKAADQGDACEQYEIGRLYCSGEGVNQNYVLAYIWVSLAAAHGDKNYAEARDDIAKMITPEQIAKAKRLVSQWKPTAAQAGH